MITDTHAHLTLPPLVEQVDDVIARAKQNGVGRIVNICTNAESLEKGLELAKRYDFIFNTAATTPHDVEKEGESFFPMVTSCAKQKQLVAIGETGLDYYYAHSPKELQQKYLRKYLELAKACDLPVVFHCREAFADLFAIVDEAYKDCRAILHCFTGTLQEAQQGVARGWMVSFSGIVTFKKSEELRQVARAIPLENIFVETDAPYLAPQSMRGKVNEPAFITETVKLLAELKGISVAEMAKITSDNSAKFFPFSKVVRVV